jgi:hypothetical protein
MSWARKRESMRWRSRLKRRRKQNSLLKKQRNRKRRKRKRLCRRRRSRDYKLRHSTKSITSLVVSNTLSVVLLLPLITRVESLLDL